MFACQYKPTSPKAWSKDLERFQRPVDKRFPRKGVVVVVSLEQVFQRVIQQAQAMPDLSLAYKVYFPTILNGAEKLLHLGSPGHMYDLAKSMVQSNHQGKENPTMAIMLILQGTKEEARANLRLGAGSVFGVRPWKLVSTF